MSGPESITPKQQPELINASELVGLLGQAGPTSSIHVRIHFKDGSVKFGKVKWNDDRVGGPAIVIPDTENPYNEGLIPLGGHTIYNQAPRISSSDNVRTTPVHSLFPFGELNAYQVPINPSTEGILFEIINEK